MLTPSSWVKVDRARKIWGILKSCTVASVKSAISRICKNSTVKVKRKVKTVSGVQTRWWFILHDSEEALVSLESNWEQLALQTSWRLVNCYMPQFSDNQDIPENHTNDALQPPPENNMNRDGHTTEDSPLAQSEGNTFLGNLQEEVN